MAREATDYSPFFGGDTNSTISDSQRSGTKCVSHSFVLNCRRERGPWRPLPKFELFNPVRGIVVPSGTFFHAEVQGALDD